jgi:hypothetical protein
MGYYEFISAEYYALISVKQRNDSMKKAMEIYIRDVGGYENMKEMEDNEIYPINISECEAKYKFVTAAGNEKTPIRKLKEEFEKYGNGILLIDNNLV